MHRPRSSTDERGSAPVEFIFAGLFLLVPLVYLMLALAQIQNAALGAEATARFVARSLASGQEMTADFVRVAVAEAYGLDADALDIGVACTPIDDECPEPGTTVIVTVRGSVALPLLPDVFGVADALSIPVEASSAYRVERLAP